MVGLTAARKLPAASVVAGGNTANVGVPIGWAPSAHGLTRERRSGSRQRPREDCGLPEDDRPRRAENVSAGGAGGGRTPGNALSYWTLSELTRGVAWPSDVRSRRRRQRLVGGNGDAAEVDVGHARE